jgi:adenine/guanine phosphoribosyltransferase-like PRPP-binding protein
MPLIVRWAEDIVLREKADAIVACGHSGLLVAGALSYVTRIPVFAVRKRGEKPVATSLMVSGVAPNGPAKRWVWIDDFLSTGGTFKRSRRYALDAGLIESEHPVAVLSYGRGRNDDEETYIGFDDKGYVLGGWSLNTVEKRLQHQERGSVIYRQYGFLDY